MKVHFLTWGRHDATNAFSHVRNVILAGTLFMPDYMYEALGRLAAARPSSSGAFEESDIVRLGELQHGVIQALCRGAVRGFVRGKCLRTDAYLVANRWSGLPQSLGKVFPGADVVDWHPVAGRLKGQAEQAFDYIAGRIEEDPACRVTFKEIADHLGIDVKNLKKIRKRPDFITELDRLSIQELMDDDGSASGFKNMYRHYFGFDNDED
jgi:hypothetical protein